MSYRGGHDDRRSGGGRRDRSTPYARGGGNNYKDTRRGGAAAGVTLKIVGLGSDCDWRALKKEFSDAGTVTRADVADGQGFVTYAEGADAAWALKNWTGQKFQGRKITITKERNSDDAKGGKKEKDTKKDSKKEKGGKKEKDSAKKGGKKEKEAKKAPADLDGDMDSYWAKSESYGKEKVQDKLATELDAYTAAAPAAAAADAAPAADAAAAPAAEAAPATAE